MPCRNCLISIVNNFLPPEARLLISKDQYKRPAIFLRDVDNDYENEVIAFYSLEGARYTIALKREENNWYVLSNVSQKSRLDLGNKARNLSLAPVKVIGGIKYGYIDNKGQFVIKPRFDYAFNFQKSGLAIAGENNIFGLIDTKGNYVLKPKYDSIDEFSEGRAIVRDKSGAKIIDEAGKEITSKAYNYIGSFRNGRAQFGGLGSSEKYIYGYLDRMGNEVIPQKFEEASDFINGIALVKINDKHYAIINLKGKVLQTFNYNFVGNLGDGLLIFQKEAGEKYGYIDLRGNIVIQPQFEGTQGFENGRAVINAAAGYKTKYGLIDRKGSIVIKPLYDNLNLLGENRVSVGKATDIEKPYMGSKYAVADTNGTFLTDFIYNNIEKYNRGLASASDNKNTFFIDKSGRIVKTMPIVSGGGSLIIQGELIKAFVDNRTSYYNMQGKLVWKQNTTIPLDNQYKVIEQKFNPNKDYLVYYPQIEGMKNKRVQLDVNNKLKKLSQVKDIPGNVQLESSYSGDFSVEFFKKNLLVLELNGYDFPFGAAHGMPTKAYPHIDLVSGSFYELKDLFKLNSNYVEVLSDIVGNMIKTQPQYEYVFPDSYKGIQPNQPFYIDENNLYLYFTPYEIAPYAAGFPTFKIPFKDIMSIINTQGSLWKAFN
ncbi:WG repeat-containing protein [Clostridium swellfunianum]|uniref:WG repeat-containing protein n=1 Tax=Clostridium swellfunianum TaxID=1367462 RepID=UPI00202EA083|nr:WG repeat-containing protein [Clostridium swellfunianum]MCM0647936.1 WG repeat-containing protein [Clostridium swellfunianum]